jgi:hypothetical protein
MEFHAIQGDRTTHVLTTHRAEVDETPLQLVSAEKVAYWQRIEAERDALMARIGPQLGGIENKLAEDCQSPAQPVDSAG